MKATGWQRSVVLALDRGIAGFSRHWLAAFNLFFFGYLALPFLAPVLMKANLPAPADMIYRAYGPMCHQLAYRSWFLFGEQSYYLAPDFEARTGIQPYTNQGRLQAKGFLGNPAMGYKVAFCERDVAIYAGILAGGLVFAAARKRVPRLHWLGYLILGIAPIGLDGFSQLFSQPPFSSLPLFSLFPFRESTPFLRTLTGALFGFVGVWFAYPHVEETMVDTQEQAEDKLRKAAKADAAAGR